jgi:putative lipoic acid-binding regulatory protein
LVEDRAGEIIMDDKNQEIQFPVDWSYRLITNADDKNCYDAILAVLKKYGINSKPEKNSKSSSGKYQAYKLQVVFESKEIMDNLSLELSAVDGVKFIL